MTVSDYLATLKAELPAPRTERDDLLEELRGHLEECARDLQLQGLSALQSEEEAVRRFGGADEMAAALVATHRGRLHGDRQAPLRQHRTGRAVAMAALLAALMAATVGGGMAAAALGSAGHTAPSARHVTHTVAQAPHAAMPTTGAASLPARR